MALAVRNVREQLAAVRRSARAAGQAADRLPERVVWVLLGAVLVVALVVASRLPVSDPVLRRLGQAPLDDEPPDAEEDADAARARAEVSIPWDQAKRQLHEAD